MFLQANDAVSSLSLDLFSAQKKEGLLVSGYSYLILKASLSARQPELSQVPLSPLQQKRLRSCSSVSYCERMCMKDPMLENSGSSDAFALMIFSCKDPLGLPTSLAKAWLRYLVFCI